MALGRGKLSLIGEALSVVEVTAAVRARNAAGVADPICIKAARMLDLAYMERVSNSVELLTELLREVGVTP